MKDFLPEILELRQKTKIALLERSAKNDVQLAKMVETLVKHKGKDFEQKSKLLYHQTDEEISELWDLYLDLGDLLITHLTKRNEVHS